MLDGVGRTREVGLLIGYLFSSLHHCIFPKIEFKKDKRLTRWAFRECPHGRSCAARRHWPACGRRARATPLSVIIIKRVPPRHKHGGVCIVHPRQDPLTLLAPGTACARCPPSGHALGAVREALRGRKGTGSLSGGHALSSPFLPQRALLAGSDQAGSGPLLPGPTFCACHVLGPALGVGAHLDLL